jgi:prepilin-type N-terminal cleavage/methylation domain-containing protein
LIRRLRLRLPLRGEHGVTLIEMIMVLAILGTVLGGVTTVFVAGSRSELQVNNRFQAQEAARLAMGAIRKDMHSACAATVKTGGNMQVTLAIPIKDPLTSPGTPNATTQCGVIGPNTAKVVYLVCTSPTNSAKYALYRLTVDPPVTPCPSAGKLVADNLVNTTGIFGTTNFFRSNSNNTTAITWGELETIDIDIPVSVKVGQLGKLFELNERLAVSNTVWSQTVDASCSAGTPCTQGPCDPVDAVGGHLACYSVHIS